MEVLYVHSNLLKNTWCVNRSLHISTCHHIFYFIKGEKGSVFFTGNYEEIAKHRLFYITPGVPYSIQCTDPEVQCFHVCFDLREPSMVPKWEKSFFTAPPHNRRERLHDLLVQLSITCIAGSLEESTVYLNSVIESIGYSNRFYSLDLATRNYGQPLASVPRHSHYSEYQIEYFQEGSGLILIGEKWFPYKEGFLCLIPPDTPHEIIFCPKQVVDNYSIKLKFGKPSDTTLPNEGFAALVPSEKQAEIHKMISEIVAQFSNVCMINSEVVFKLFRAITSLWTVLNLDKSYSNAVQEALNIIDEDFSDPTLRLSTLAHKVMVSPEHLSRSFHNEIGVNFSRYILLKRLGFGVHLLKTTDYPIKHIAGNCGFRSANYFMATIKKEFLMTANEIRYSCAIPIKR